MTAEEFKTEWKKISIPEIDTWIDFAESELRKAPLKEETIEFLKGGFPGSAAPCLSFGWESNESKFLTIPQMYNYMEFSEEHYKNNI